MGYKPLIKLILILAFMLLTWTLWGQAGLYTVTGDKVNIRSGPGKGYSVISSRKKGDTLTVLSFYDANWAKIRYGSSFAYMSRQYLAYRSPLPQEANSQKQASKTKIASGGWDSLYEIVKTILWLCALVIIIGGLFGTNWGLKNGYVSGEWWRSDRNTQWWEICMYDRQNRYNDSWRIRPIYAINSDTGIMQRVSGGTAHWLFRKMVWDDLMFSISHMFD